jgi:tryptophan-rich sensory protein
MNLLWAPVFFQKKMLRAGQAINITLLATLTLILPQFYSLDQNAALLLLPYMCWATFATFLNGNICKRNPTDKYGYNNAKFQAGLIQLQREASDYAFS